MYILTFDIGTTSMKATVFSDAFRAVDAYLKEYALQTSPGGIVGLEPNIYWDAFKEASAYFSGKGLLGDVRAAAVTTQGETLVAVDVYGNALDNAVVWLDTRAEKEAEILRGLYTVDEFYSKTGMPDISAAMPVCKLFWYKHNRPEVYKRAHKFLLLEDYLLYKLTGRYVSNHSILSSTGYFDITSNIYWTDILNAIGFDADKLPDILPSGVPVGAPTLTAQKETGLGPRTVVATSAMDQIASAVGAGNIKPGMLTVTAGTALATAAAVESPDFGMSNKTTVYRHFDSNYIYLPYCATAAIILKWFKDEFLGAETEYALSKGISPYDYAAEIACGVPPGSGGLLLLPHFAGKLSPDFNPDIKGVFYGVGLDTGKGHFIRAIMEGVAYMLRENLEFMHECGIFPAGENIPVEGRPRANRSGKNQSGAGLRPGFRLLGGVARSPLWSQIIADVYGVPVYTMENPETACLGAAVMAALASGLYKTADEICENFIRTKAEYFPDPQLHAVYDDFYAQYADIYEKLAR
jgi:xylulokinase